ncbi:MAG: hypothetical protein N3G80_01105 [Candidatus Micrarchaeota archaeon]|nr:hypothetical protein [Candidatus Micrarchaeota archaeon]
MPKGFVFSVDAFVAFTIVMLTVAFLTFTVGTPKPYYYSLQQAHQLAYDTLMVISSTTDDPTKGTYLEQILNGANPHEILAKIAGGAENSSSPYRPIIPQGFGYSLEIYRFADNSWRMLYDSGNNPNAAVRGCDYLSNRCGRKFTKISASATTFGSMYVIPPNPGQSPFCYLSCTGYGRTSPECDITPCNNTISNFLPGKNSISVVRFTVYA